MGRGRGGISSFRSPHKKFTRQRRHVTNSYVSDEHICLGLTINGCLCSVLASNVYTPPHLHRSLRIYPQSADLDQSFKGRTIVIAQGYLLEISANNYRKGCVFSRLGRVRPRGARVHATIPSPASQFFSIQQVLLHTN